jgi:hypothetical protein
MPLEAPVIKIRWSASFTAHHELMIAIPRL